MISDVIKPCGICIESEPHRITLKSLKWFRLKKGLSFFGFATDFPQKLLNSKYYIIQSSGKVELEEPEKLKVYKEPHAQILFNFKTVSSS